MSNRRSHLPAVMNQLPNPRIVQRAYLCHGQLRKRWEIRGTGIVDCLSWILGSWNRATYGIEHQDPTQRELRHGCSLRHKRAESIHRPERDIVIHTRKGFTHVERLAV